MRNWNNNVHVLVPNILAVFSWNCFIIVRQLASSLWFVLTWALCLLNSEINKKYPCLFIIKRNRKQMGTCNDHKEFKDIDHCWYTMATSINHNYENEDSCNIEFPFFSFWWGRKYRNLLLNNFVDWNVNENNGKERDQTKKDGNCCGYLHKSILKTIWFIFHIPLYIVNLILNL